MKRLEVDQFCDAMMKCVDNDDLEQIKQLLSIYHTKQYHYEMNLPSLLSWSIYKKHDDITYYLLSSTDILRHPILSSIHGGEIPLIVTAATVENYDVVKYMLTSQDVAEKARIDDDEHSLFKTVARNGNIDMIDYLLFSPELKQHSDYQANGHDAVSMMAFGGHIPAIKYMLDKFDDKDEIIDAAIIGAINNNQIDLLKFIFSIDTKHQLTALFWSMCKEKKQMQEFLILDCNIPKTPELEKIFERKIFQAKPDRIYYAKKLIEVRDLDQKLSNSDNATRTHKI